MSFCLLIQLGSLSLSDFRETQQRIPLDTVCHHQLQLTSLRWGGTILEPEHVAIYRDILREVPNLFIKKRKKGMETIEEFFLAR